MLYTIFAFSLSHTHTQHTDANPPTHTTQAHRPTLTVALTHTHNTTQQEKLDTASPGLLNTLQPSLLIFWVSLLLRVLSLLGPPSPRSRNAVFSPSSAVP